MIIEKENLYKLPFSKHDNPVGWIEPTTFCQLKCPDCYRGTDRDDFVPAHRDIDDVKKEIDKLVKIRNIQSLTIAGGEPLLYPFLDEIVKYAGNKKLKVLIDTNGILLDEKRLIELRDLGATRIVVHIDKYQKRGLVNNENKANELRKEYCDLFRKVGGISLGFIMPISGDNVDDLEIIIPFLKDNTDIIKIGVFTILGKTFSDDPLPANKTIDHNEVFTKVKKLYGLEYCSYLKKTISDNPAWLFSYNVFAGKKFLGSTDKDIAKLVQEENYKKEKRYFKISNDDFKSMHFIIKEFLNKSVQKIILRYLKSGCKGKIHQQAILVVSSPQFINGQLDLCTACPHAIFYREELVPSCLLERVKRGENIKLE